jgi:hypothetical protein
MAGAERQQCIDGIRVRPSHGRIWAYLVINFREGYSVRDMDGGPLNQPQWRDLQYRALQSRPDRGHLYENGAWQSSPLDPRVLQFKAGILMSPDLCDELLERVERSIFLARLGRPPAHPGRGATESRSGRLHLHDQSRPHQHVLATGNASNGACRL